MEAKCNILKKENLSCLLQPETLAGFQPLKEETNTRLILRGHLANSKEGLIIKIFKRPHFFDQVKYLFRPPRSRKEWQISQKLSHLGIPTPSLVAYVALRRSCFLTKDLVVFREISNVEPLINWIEKNFIQKTLPLSERKKVVRTLGGFVRKIHDRGIFSNDFHQGNILIKTEPGKPPLFYLSDLHAIRVKKELTLQERIKNLSQFNNFRIPVSDRMRFLSAYLQAGGLKGVSKKTLAKEIASVSFTHWGHLWQKRKKRSLRPGKGLKAFEVGPWKGMSREEFFLENSFPFFDWLSSEFKGTGSFAKEVLYPENGKSLIIRYYKQTNFFSHLKTVGALSPAKRAWVIIHNLIMRGIPTVSPVAFGEKKRCGILQHCFIAYKKIPEEKPNLFSLSELLTKTSFEENPSLKKEFLFKLARLIRWMHQTGVSIKGMNAGDFWMTLHNEKISLFLGDWQGITIEKTVGRHEVAQELKMIGTGVLETFSRAEQDFFLKIYSRRK